MYPSVASLDMPVCVWYSPLIHFPCAKAGTATLPSIRPAATAATVPRTTSRRPRSNVPIYVSLIVAT